MMTIRLAEQSDISEISELMNRAIHELQIGFLSIEQIEASQAGMGLDRQLVADGTYFCVIERSTIIGCGGWSRRATLYGGDHSDGRDSRRLDPATEAARIRAMYTHPLHVRKGVAGLILSTAEAAAKQEGFASAALVGTMAGRAFYQANGYEVIEEWSDTNGAVPVPLVTMQKTLG